MKKILLFATAVLALSVISCNGSKKEGIDVTDHYESELVEVSGDTLLGAKAAAEAAALPIVDGRINLTITGVSYDGTQYVYTGTVPDKYSLKDEGNRHWYPSYIYNDLCFLDSAVINRLIELGQPLVYNLSNAGDSTATFTVTLTAADLAAKVKGDPIPAGSQVADSTYNPDDTYKGPGYINCDPCL